jgi:hypothetical protein
VFLAALKNPIKQNVHAEPIGTKKSVSVRVEEFEIGKEYAL